MSFVQGFTSAFKKSWKNGAIVGLLAIGLSYLISWLNIKPIELTFSTINVRQQIASQGMLPQLGQRVIDFIQNIIPVQANMPALVIMLITVVLGGILALGLGTWIYGLLGEFNLGPIGRTKATRTAIRLLIGTTLLSLLLIGVTGIPALSVVVAMFIYYLIIAFVMAAAVNLKIIRAE